MSDIYTSSNVYQGTFVIGTVEVDPIFQICAVANVDASNMFECTFWINENGNRVDNNLGNASYRVRDKGGALVSGMSSVSVSPDLNGYFKITPVSAAQIYDLNHYILEIEIPVNGQEKSSSIGLVKGD